MEVNAIGAALDASSSRLHDAAPVSACGLDFGTSNSAVALPSGRVLPIDAAAVETRLFRSVLFFAEEERGFYAGAAAIDEYLQHGQGRFIQSVKTWLPSRTFTATQIRNRALRLDELVGMLLGRIRIAAEQVAGESLSEVVLGRPALFSRDPAADALAEERLAAAARAAGFTRVEFLIEPIAAALAYETTLAVDELVLVADFGAGTSDLTLMRLGPSRRGGDRRCDVVGTGGVSIGGDRFDAEIMRHKLLPFFGAGSSYEVDGKRMPIPPHLLGKLLSWHEMSFIREKGTRALIERMLRSSDQARAIEALEDLVEENLGYRLFQAIERAKIEISSADQAPLDFEEARIHVHTRVTRAEFERYVAPLIDTLDECVEELLRRTSTEAARVDAVFLTGGSSQIPLVRQRFARRFGEGRLRTADAFTTVAEGLGRAAAKLARTPSTD